MDTAQRIAAGRGLLAQIPGIAEVALIGSAMYLPDPVDIDFAVMLQPDEFAGVFGAALTQDHDWKACSEDYPLEGNGSVWFSVRKGDVNLMLTHSREFFDGYKRAMEVCKALNLTDKADRIKVCAIVRDGKTADEAQA